MNESSTRRPRARTTTRAIDVPDVAGGEADRVSHGSARSLLLTLLGEFVLPMPGPVWTNVLLRALAGVGVAEKAARQAIARAAASGWIDSERAGRRAAWRLSDRGRRLIGDGSARLRALTHETSGWQGPWLLLHVSLPEARRADRLRLYRALAWAGCGNPTPGIWISPHGQRLDEVRRIVGQFDLAAHTLAAQAELLDFGMPLPDLVARAWDLRRVDEHYAALVRRFSALRPRGDVDVLFAHVQLVNALQRLPFIDPGLPKALLPADWPAARQWARLAALRERWRDRAHACWDDWVAAEAA